ncbi:MAG: hypothetical protein ACR2P1_21200 [Pseudomonadales bacterium]
MFFNFVVRDILFFALVYLLWQWLAPLSAEQGLLADFVGVALGGLVALSFHLVHEWGHVAGGLLSHSKMTVAPSMQALSLMTYHSTGNSKAQFMLMSVLGFAATGLVVWFSYTQLPDGLFASRIARGFSLVQVFLAIVIELPLVAWALFGKSLPPLDKKLGRHDAEKAVSSEVV